MNIFIIYHLYIYSIEGFGLSTIAVLGGRDDIVVMFIDEGGGYTPHDGFKTLMCIEGEGRGIVMISTHRVRCT